MSKKTASFIAAVTANDLDATAKALDAGANINAVIPKTGRHGGIYADKGTPMLAFVACGLRFAICGREPKILLDHTYERPTSPSTMAGDEESLFFDKITDDRIVLMKVVR